MGEAVAARGRDYWAKALAAGAVLAALLMLARQLRLVVGGFAFYLRMGYVPYSLSVSSWVRLAIWVLVVVSVFAGWRGATLIGAWLGVAEELLVLVTSPRSVPGVVFFWLWPLALAVVTAALLSGSGSPRDGTGLLGPRRLVALSMAGIVATLPPVGAVLLGTATPPPVGASGVHAVLSVDGRLDGLFTVAVYAAVGFIVIFTVLGLARPIRRRLLAIFAALGTFIVIGQLQPDSPVADYSLNPAIPPLLLNTALTAAPLLVFGAGLFVNYYLEKPRTAVTALAIVPAQATEPAPATVPAPAEPVTQEPVTPEASAGAS